MIVRSVGEAPEQYPEYDEDFDEFGDDWEDDEFVPIATRLEPEKIENPNV